jgi:hypothetical protein
LKVKRISKEEIKNLKNEPKLLKFFNAKTAAFIEMNPDIINKERYSTAPP